MHQILFVRHCTIEQHLHTYMSRLKKLGMEPICASDVVTGLLRVYTRKPAVLIIGTDSVNKTGDYLLHFLRGVERFKDLPVVRVHAPFSPADSYVYDEYTWTRSAPLSPTFLIKLITSDIFKLRLIGSSAMPAIASLPASNV